MKTTYKTVIIAIATAVLMSACGNAGAQNDKKQAKTTDAKKVMELNAAQFDSMVYDLDSDALEYLGDKPAIVDFTASWCGPCQRIAPILEELATEYNDKIVIYKVDIDKERKLAEAFGISSIPAILYIPAEGEPVMTVGARDKAKFRNEISTYLL